MLAKGDKIHMIRLVKDTAWSICDNHFLDAYRTTARFGDTDTAPRTDWVFGDYAAFGERCAELQKLGFSINDVCQNAGTLQTLKGAKDYVEEKFDFYAVTERECNTLEEIEEHSLYTCGNFGQIADYVKAQVETYFEHGYVSMTKTTYYCYVGTVLRRVISLGS